jgi:hypothetical protein
MNQTSTILVVCGVALVVLTLVVLFGFLAVSTGGSLEDEGTSPQEAFIPRNEPPVDGSTGVVYIVDKTGPDWTLWSLQILSPRYRAAVAFVPPAGCNAPSAGVGRLLPEDACAGVPARGEITGGGTRRADGVKYVIVTVSIDQRCFEVLRVNDIWPSAHAACIE